jgi:glyoxylase-like metal-dependent hydrolase (beta-lactamase superfamily II)
MAAISLEDNFTDIIGKAQRGLNLSDAALANRAEISERDLNRVKAGEVIEEAIFKVATALHLGPGALVESARAAWSPKPIQLEGLAQFTTPYGGMTVNAYLVWDSQSKGAVAFDTGADAKPMLDFIKKNQLNLRYVFLTHSHGDHIADLERLKRTTSAPAYISENEPMRGANCFPEGQAFAVDALRIATRQTSGHSTGGTTYVVNGLGKPVAVVGDALFAGSMGGGMVSYSEALSNNRAKIMTLPDETILCPGHGPLTTVGEEKLHNPFFPEFSASADR